MAPSTGPHSLVQALGCRADSVQRGRLLGDSRDKPARFEQVRGERVPRAGCEGGEAVRDRRGELALAQRLAPDRGESAVGGDRARPSNSCSRRSLSFPGTAWPGVRNGPHETQRVAPTKCGFSLLARSCFRTKAPGAF
jgi:hypothetical protein